MDRVSDDASEVAVTDSRAGRERDKLYRRPPAHPPAEATMGGSWFTDSTEVPEVEPRSESPAATSSRVSFGFTSEPISPVRHGPTSAPPAMSTSPDPSGLPIRRQGTPAPAHAAPDSPISSGSSSALRGPSGSSSALRGPSGGSPALRGPSGSSSALRAPSGERRAVRSEPPPPPRKQGRGVTVGMVILSLIVLVTGSVIGVVYFSGSDDGLDSVLQLGASDNAKRTVTAPLDNRSKASFELLAGANTVHLTIGELGDELYRISTPDDAGILPSPIVQDDDVKLQVNKDGDGTGGEIEVVLAAKVRWQLRFSGYAEKQVIDVSGGQISGIEMVAGMREAQLTLSSPTGTVPVKINGAVDKLTLKSPADNPVRIKVGGGAQTVVAGSRTLKDVAAGSTLTPKGWDTTNRYDVTAGARITSLTVENA